MSEMNNTGNSTESLTGTENAAPSTPEVASPVINESVGFMDMLSSEIKSEASLQDFKDVDGLAKSYVSAQKMLGSSIRIPTEDASDESKQEFFSKLTDVPGVYHIPVDGDMSKVYNQLGRPENVEGYKVEVDAAFNDNAISAFKNRAHEEGFTNKQLNAALEIYAGEATQYTESIEKYHEQSVEVLKGKWGSDFDNRMKGANHVLDQYAEKYPDFIAEFKDPANPFSHNPIMVMALSELHGAMAESGVVGNQQGVAYGTSRDDAKAKLADIRGNLSHPYYDDSNPAHKEAVDKVTKLSRIAYD